MKKEPSISQLMLCFTLFAVPCLLFPLVLAILILQEFPLVLILTVTIATAHIGNYWTTHSVSPPNRKQIVKAAIRMTIIFVAISMVFYTPAVSAANATVDNGPLWKWPLLDALKEILRFMAHGWDEIWRDGNAIALGAFFLGEAFISFGLIVTALFYGRYRAMKNMPQKTN